MKPQRKPRWITDLTAVRQIRRLQTYGLHLAAGVTVHFAVEETGFDKKFLFLRFVKEDGTEHKVLLTDDIDLIGLPFALTSLRVLARGAQKPMQGLSLQNLGARLFETAIDKYAKTEIALGIDTLSKKEVVRFSVTLKKYASSAVCPFSELEGFVEKFDDHDPERDNEEE